MCIVHIIFYFNKIDTLKILKAFVVLEKCFIVELCSCFNDHIIVYFCALFQTRNLLGVFERDSDLLRSYVLNLHRCCNRVLTAQVCFWTFKSDF